MITTLLKSVEEYHHAMEELEREMRRGYICLTGGRGVISKSEWTTLTWPSGSRAVRRLVAETESVELDKDHIRASAEMLQNWIQHHRIPREIEEGRDHFTACLDLALRVAAIRATVVRQTKELESIFAETSTRPPS